MYTQMNAKRILIFLAFAFGIPWVAALAVFLTDWLAKEAQPERARAIAGVENV